MGEPQTNDVQPSETPATDNGGGAPSSPTPEQVAQGSKFVDVNARPAEGEETNPPDPATPAVEPKEGESVDDESVRVGNMTLEGNNLRNRLARERSKTLKEVYGTDDVDEIEKIKEKRELEKKELARLARIEKARARARQSAEERTRADLESKDARIKELENEIAGIRTDAQVREQDEKIAEVGGQYIRADRMRYAKRDLAEHLNSLTPEKLKKFGPKQLDKFFEDLALKNPDFAHPKEDPPEDVKPPKKPKPRVRKGVTTGANPGRKAPVAPADGSGMWRGKVLKPGQPNSMTPQEVRAYYASQGKKMPY